METSFKPITILSFLCGVALLAACAQAAPSPTAAGTTAPSQTESAPEAQTFDDPFAYCAAVGTVDQPDARYTGPEKPEAVVKGVMQASGAAADAPLEVFSQGTVWRCMDQQVYACFVGANLPCESKANTSQEPTQAMNEYCQANPQAEFIPAVATGHDTIYAWSCKDGQAQAGEAVFQVDPQGYIQEIWYALAP